MYRYKVFAVEQKLCQFTSYIIVPGIHKASSMRDGIASNLSVDKISFASFYCFGIRLPVGTPIRKTGERFVEWRDIFASKL